MCNANRSTIPYVDDESNNWVLMQTLREDALNKVKLICTNDGYEPFQNPSIASATLLSLRVSDLDIPRRVECCTLGYLKSHRHFAAIPIVFFLFQNVVKRKMPVNN